MTINVLAWPAKKNKRDNPYNALLYDAMPDFVSVTEYSAKIFPKQHWDIFHLHWPDLRLRHSNPLKILIGTHRLLRQIRQVQHAGGKVVWTAHNIRPHKVVYPRLAAYCWNKIAAQLDAVIYLNEYGRDKVQQAYPVLREKISAIIPHGHYRDYYEGDTKEKRDSQELISCLLHFGKLRPHKGVEELVGNFCELRDTRCKLIVAGNPDKSFRRVLNMPEVAAVPGVEWRLQHIEDHEIVPLFNQVDAVILPYRDILNSGTAILALSLNRPVIAADVGTLTELRKQFGDNWVYLYRAPLTPAKLNEAISWLKQRIPEELDISPLDWQPLAENTANFYRSLLDKD